MRLPHSFSAVSVSEVEALFELFKSISSSVIDDGLISKVCDGVLFELRLPDSMDSPVMFLLVESCIIVVLTCRISLVSLDKAVTEFANSSSAVNFVFILLFLTGNG